MNSKWDLVLKILTSILATLLVHYFSATYQYNSILGLIFSFLTILILVAIINYQKPLLLMFQNPGRWRLPTTQWDSIWEFQKSGQTVSVYDKVTIKQIGRYIYGRGESYRVENASFKNYRYSIRGSINNEGILEGKWANINNGRNYYGLFLLNCHRNGCKLSGTWIGLNNSGTNSGNWNWTAEVRPSGEND